MQNIIDAVSIRKEFKVGSDKISVLDGIDLSVSKGEIVAIVGPSGSGKSTLLNILGGLESPTSGKVLYEGVDIFSKSDDEITRFRSKHIGFVFQNHMLIRELTAIENVALSAMISGNSKKLSFDLARDMLEKVALKERLRHKPGKLSGGECQRVSIARALVNRPSVVLCDEPTGNLDNERSESIFSLIKELNDKNGETFLIVTHNSKIASRSDKVVKL